jgi:hypothetical protein
MKERPIIFRGEMVKAILEGRKTQTRRPIKPQPVIAHDGKWDLYIRGIWVGAIAEKNNLILNICPYGQPGDRLWVKETWCPLERCDWVGNKKEQNINYRAMATSYSESMRKEMGYIWRSPIFIPRWASRISLEIVNVRPERLTDITVESAKAEGITPAGVEGDGRRWRGGFRDLWDSIYSKKNLGWNINPWCWCITFKRII